MKFLSGEHLPRRKVDRITSLHSLFIVLEQSQFLSKENTGFLEELVSAVSRDDVLDDIQKFRGTTVAFSVQNTDKSTYCYFEPH